MVIVFPERRQLTTYFKIWHWDIHSQLWILASVKRKTLWMSLAEHVSQPPPAADLLLSLASLFMHQWGWWKCPVQSFPTLLLYNRSVVSLFCLSLDISIPFTFILRLSFFLSFSMSFLVTGLQFYPETEVGVNSVKNAVSLNEKG